MRIVTSSIKNMIEYRGRK